MKGIFFFYYFFLLENLGFQEWDLAKPPSSPAALSVSLIQLPRMCGSELRTPVLSPLPLESRVNPHQFRRKKPKVFSATIVCNICFFELSTQSSLSSGSFGENPDLQA